MSKCALKGKHCLKVGDKVITTVERNHHDPQLAVEIGSVGEIVFCKEINFLGKQYFVDFGGQYVHGYTCDSIQRYEEKP